MLAQGQIPDAEVMENEDVVQRIVLSLQCFSTCDQVVPAEVRSRRMEKFVAEVLSRLCEKGIFQDSDINQLLVDSLL